MTPRRTRAAEGRVDPTASAARHVGRYIVAFYAIHVGVLIAMCGLVQHAMRHLPWTARRR